MEVRVDVVGGAKPKEINTSLWRREKVDDSRSCNSVL